MARKHACAYHNTNAAGTACWRSSKFFTLVFYAVKSKSESTLTVQLKAFQVFLLVSSCCFHVLLHLAPSRILLLKTLREEGYSVKYTFCSKANSLGLETAETIYLHGCHLC